MQLQNLFLYTALMGMIVAHPDVDTQIEVQRKAEHLARPDRRTLADCKRELEESGYYEHRLSRRLEKANALRAGSGYAPSLSSHYPLVIEVLANNRSPPARDRPNIGRCS